jgi:hypothetical protein
MQCYVHNSIQLQYRQKEQKIVPCNMLYLYTLQSFTNKGNNTFNWNSWSTPPQISTGSPQWCMRVDPHCTTHGAATVACCTLHSQAVTTHCADLNTSPVNIHYASHHTFNEQPKQAIIYKRKWEISEKKLCGGEIYHGMMVQTMH